MNEYNKTAENFEEGAGNAPVNPNGIDLGCDNTPAGFDPFAAPTAETAPVDSEQPTVEQNATPAAETDAPTTPPPQSEESDSSEKAVDAPESAETTEPPVSEAKNPLEAAIAETESKQAEQSREGLLSKPPMFCYAGATEEISDTAKTFEELRKEKATEFPELEEEDRVSWKVIYGKVVKAVSKPKEDSVAKIKSEIEMSKEFFDGLKKSKGEIVCKVEPTVTAKKKGEMSSYRGIFTNLEDAVKSKKLISILPSDDGKVYEVRCNEIGCFIAPVRNTKGLSSIRAGFTPALPLIPQSIIEMAIAFFRAFMVKAGDETEALVNIYWDKVEEKYYPHVPRQTVTKAEVNAEMPDIDTDRFVLVMEIHSHNTMAAKFSKTDDEDEKATRIYMVIGRLNKLYPEIAVRISCGGEFVNISPHLVIDAECSSYPSEWLDKVTVAKKKVSAE